MNKLFFVRRFFLNKTHWYCLSCGDFHRYGDLREGCPVEALEKAYDYWPDELPIMDFEVEAFE